jgi:predicted CXXCH cytochrome family protein
VSADARRAVAALGALLAVAVGSAWYFLIGAQPSAWAAPNSRSTMASANFVGSEACASCHQAEARLWQTSHHFFAMQHATGKSVLGDFSGVSFEHFGMRSKFYRRGGKFLVETDGADGKPAEFQVQYTFGLAPLQQYLVAFPGGRLQALPIAWDSRPKSQGGQRWFHLYPNDKIGHDDALHWTKPYQNWNYMCAECHSTGVRKNYNALTDSFATRWSEISVGCEACHGQGSRHVAWAHAQMSGWRGGKDSDPNKGLLVRFDERSGAVWQRIAETGNARRSAPLPALRKEVETCGRCHARRSEFSEDWIPGHWLSDTHLVSPLMQTLYEPDGQMLDEVYNYGSFRQSKMFAAGVTCSDCHEPHSDALRAPGDGVCLQCHSAGKYATPAHDHHASAQPALVCASCHMPSRTYMVVDVRHDHSFRIPRPDLSVTLGTPNACNDCHKDKSPQWAAAAVAKWYGPNRKGFQTYAAAFHAAWMGGDLASQLLAAVTTDPQTPSFARAGAWEALGNVSPSSTATQKGLSDPDPMVRIAALDSLAGARPEQIWPMAAQLLSDRVRGVRLRAAWLLAPVPRANQPEADRAAFDRAAQEFVAAQRFNADRADARTTLGSYFVRRGMASEAESEFQAGMRLDRHYAPAAIGLADLYRQQNRDGNAEAVLRKAITASPRDAQLRLAHGLALIRLHRVAEALAELQRAVQLAPDDPANAYVYAVALNSSGRAAEAIVTLKESLAKHPADRDTLMALATFSRDSGDGASALKYARQLTRTFPNDPDAAALVVDLQRTSETR